MRSEATGPPARAGAFASGRRPDSPRLEWLAAALLALGLVAALPVLVQRARVEAGYRQVALVAELPGASWSTALPSLGPALRERGVSTLLLPAERLDDPLSLDAVRASGFPVFLFWSHTPTLPELDEGLERSRRAGLEVLLAGGVSGGGADGPNQGDESTRLGGGPLIALVELEGSPFWTLLARKDPGRSVVVHRIPPADWTEYQGAGAFEARLARYVRAVRERQVRALVLPVLPGPDGSPDLGYVEAAAERLRADGFRLGGAPVLPPFGASGLQRFLVGAAVGAALFLTVRLLPGSLGFGNALRWARGPSWAALPGLVGTSLVLGLVALVPSLTPGPGDGPGASGAALAAFVAAVVFPTWAVLSLRLPGGSPAAGVNRPLPGLVRATLLSLAGGLLVAGLLSDRSFLLRLDVFRGVKAMHLLPPLLVGAVLLPAPLRAFVSQAWGRAGHPGTVTAPQRGGLSWAGAGLAALAALLVAAVGIYYLGRTGNELVPVPAWERHLRDWIEAVLGARPRFKELFGHASLVAGLAVLAGPGPTVRGPAPGSGGVPGGAPGEAGPGPVAWLVGTGLVVGGSVGQLSLVNSLAHVHQPLLFTLQRIAYGWVGGLVLGLFLAVAVRWRLGRVGDRTPGAAGAGGGEPGRGTR
ncbi:DUF5693 family protein [Limnochorda pilosa]|uniref:Uncharacterized protein n=1 Tax=Limnochorda pilosa TaxID=1555112 RepID=A0A0K2SP52_LIMPI|nr:DUF5693 family protein [Limnochorda pilosa]BAS28772.1 hypothetical protein LIP_2943 [Limnochorda pilosa]